MEIAEALDVVRTQHNAVLATMRRDGTPQMTPVTAGVDAGTVIVSSRETAYKVRHLRRDPRAWLCVLPDTFMGRWISLACTTTIEPLPEAMDVLVRYYRDIRGEHPDWDEYRAAMTAQGKALLRITPQRWGPIATGGFPARLG
jgi:PPOX class probable F420-dependent enzyme